MGCFCASKIVKQQLKRESAYLWGGSFGCYATALRCCRVFLSVWCSSKRGTDRCLQCYPSLDRSAYLPSGSVTFFRRSLPQMVSDIGYQRHSLIELTTVGVNSDALTKSKLGLVLCRKNQSSLPQWLCLALQVVLKVTSSVALQAQALVLLPQKFWAQTQQAQHWLAQQSACFATTQASTAVSNFDTRALTGHIDHWNRRRGHPPAAVLYFGDAR